MDAILHLLLYICIGITFETCSNTDSGACTQSFYLDLGRMIDNTQLVLSAQTLDNANMNYTIFVDGNYASNFVKTSCSINEPVNALSWAANDYLRFLGSWFDSDNANPSWNGELYSFTLFNDSLTSVSVKTLFENGSPNALPVVNSMNVTVQQNGEMGDHSNEPRFYESPIPSNEVSVITLDADDRDELETSHPYSSSRRSAAKVQLLSLPLHGGTLYYMNGTEILNPFTIISRNRDYNNTFVVRYRPIFDQYSDNVNHTLDSFRFRAVDGYVSNTYSINNATVGIIVSRVNRPPVPQENNTAMVYAGKWTVLPVLNGTDSDGVISRLAITSLPAYGQLFSITNTMAYTNDTAALTPNSTSPDAIVYLDSLRLAYKYTGPQNMTLRDGGILTGDRFSFKLVDNEGAISRMEWANITIKTALTALSTTVYSSSDDNVAIEGQYANVIIKGVDHSDEKRDLLVELVRTPRHGNIVSRSNRASIFSANSTLDDVIPGSGEYSVGANISYIGNEDFFSIPSTAWDGSAISVSDHFTFRVRASDGAYSLTTQQFVAVKNRHDAVEISFAVDSDVWTNGNIEVYAISPIPDEGDDSEPTTHAIISGFSVTDYDHGADLVKAHISSSANGKLTLNPYYIDGLDFNSATYCYSSMNWQCRGSGYYNSEMIFLGTPVDVQNALNGLRYENAEPYVTDNITVLLHSGEGGNCLSNALGSDSIRNGCSLRSTSFTVNVLGHVGQADDNDSRFDDVSPLALPAHVSYVVLGILALCSLVCFCSIVKCMRKKMAIVSKYARKMMRSTKQEQEEDEEREEGSSNGNEEECKEEVRNIDDTPHSLLGYHHHDNNKFGRQIEPTHSARPIEYAARPSEYVDSNMEFTDVFRQEQTRSPIVTFESPSSKSSMKKGRKRSKSRHRSPSFDIDQELQNAFAGNEGEDLSWV